MKTKKKSLAAVMCVLLAILTVFAMMPNLSYADTKGGVPETKSSAPVKRSFNLEEFLKKLAAYNAISDTFAEYKDARNSIKGDILIKGSGDSSYDTESDHGYAVKEGNTYTLGLKLDVTGVKQDLKDIKSKVLSTPAVTDYFNYMGNGGLDVVGVKNLQSELVANISIPDGLDASSEEVQNALGHLQLRDNFGQYTSNASVHVDNTDVKDYDLSGYKFAVTDAKLDDHKNIRIVMDLQIPKNYNGKSYDDISQFNFACLYAVVENMPDVFTLEIPGIKADATKKIEKMTINGSMGQQSDTSDCFMSAALTYSGSYPFRTNWYATQMDGGQDALNSNGISLTTVRKAAVQYDANGGKGTMEPTEGILQDQVQAADNQFTRSGYSFSGWNTKADGSGTAYKSGDSVSLDDETVTLYAQWTENSTPVIPDTPVTPTEEHTITFHPNNDQPTFTQVVPDGGQAVQPENPSNSGFTFGGWYTDSSLTKAYDFTLPVKSNLDLYAKWTKKTPNVKPSKPTKKVTGILLPKVIAKGKHTQVFTWTALNNVDGYFIYTNHCDEGKKLHPFKKVADYKASRARVYTVRNLKTYDNYKYYVAAYKIKKNGKKQIVRNSVTVHSVCGNTSARSTNVKAVKAAKHTITLKKGQSYRLKASVYKVNKKRAFLDATHCGLLRYLSRDRKIATVDYNTGRIKGVKAGKTTVYVLGVNGIRDKVVVTVK